MPEGLVHSRPKPRVKIYALYGSAPIQADSVGELLLPTPAQADIQLGDCWNRYLLRWMTPL
jgi:hypothetical protein